MLETTFSGLIWSELERAWVGTSALLREEREPDFVRSPYQKPKKRVESRKQTNLCLLGLETHLPSIYIPGTKQGPFGLGINVLKYKIRTVRTKY